MISDNKRQCGEIMMESILVLIPTLLVLGFLMSIGFIYYQRWNVQITANETASKVAEYYSYAEVKLSEGICKYSEVQNRAPYRYFFGNKKELDSAAETKGCMYMKDYLSLVTFKMINQETNSVSEELTPTQKIQVEEDAFGCRHIHVTIQATYKIPLGVFLEVFMMPDTYTFKAESYAVCTDLSDYLTTTNYLKNLDGLLNLKNNSMEKAISSFVSLMKKVRGTTETVVEDILEKD